MDQNSLVIRKIETGNRFLREFEKSVPVAVAFWLKARDDGPWNFYVASDQFDKLGVREAYRELARISKEQNDPDFEPFQVRMVGLGEPVVQAAVESYRRRAPGTPFSVGSGNFGDIDVDEVHFVKGPTGGGTMASGRDVLHQIIDQEANFFQKHGKQPRRMKLPVLMAYDLAKCGRDDLGELSGRVFKDGITAFEKEGFHGMGVEIVRDRDATLQLE